MANLPDPNTWHIPTRLKTYGFRGGQGITLADFFSGVVCHLCRIEVTDLADAFICNGEICCTDTKACAARRAELNEPHRPASALAAEKEAARKAQAKKDAPAQPESATAGKERPGRVFTCETCGKKKRTKSTRGRLPKVCQTCKAKEAA